MWGWIPGGGTAGYPWNGILTLPRVLTLRADGRLGMEPLPELKALRGRHYEFGAFSVACDTVRVLPEIKSDCLEIIAELEPGNAASFGIELRRSPGGEEKTNVCYDAATMVLSSGDRGGGFQLLPGEETLKLHIFMDKSVVEVYANSRECITLRVYPKRADSLGMSLFAHGGAVKVRSLDVWEMKTIW
jgi:beta-fructofuranosidase